MTSFLPIFASVISNAIYLRLGFILPPFILIPFFQLPPTLELGIVPAMNLHQSSREMALKMDELLPAGEPMPHYSSIRDSALFYTDRPLQLIRNHKELSDLLSNEEQVYCAISASRYREMGLQAPIVYEIGDDLLISNIRSKKFNGFFPVFIDTSST